ncbi:MAG: hypothetical protein IKT40_02860 [Bacilli bacterium]|nr:hypothetical protein [Bacilli bacterium]
MNILLTLFTAFTAAIPYSEFTETPVNTYEGDNIIKVTEECNLVNCDDEMILYNSQNIYNLGTIQIDGCIDSVNEIFMFCNEEHGARLYSFNKFNQSIDETYLENVYIAKIYNHQNQIYLVGKENNDGLLLVLDYDFNVTDKRVFYSNGDILVNNLFFVDDYYYITIYKSAIANNSEFINQGNIGEYKSILVSLDDGMSVDNVYYFNHNMQNEIIKNIFIKDEIIYLLLETLNSIHLYQLTKDFYVIDYRQLETIHDYDIMPNYKNNSDYLIIDKESKELMRYSNQTLSSIFEFINVDKLLDYRIYNGELYYYGIKDDQIVVNKISEYEIEYQNDLIVSRLNLNYQTTDHFKVSSYFEEFSFSLESISPYFEITNCGSYTATYSATRKNNETINIKTKLIVEPFTNFIDQGIYNTNKVLEFFGTATLNGKQIYYGEVITDPGEYEITINDVNGNQTKYQIYICEDFYLEEEVTNINPDIYCEDMGIVKINIGNANVTEVVIDNDIYENYEVVSNTLIIKFPYTNARVVSHTINKIKYQNNNIEYYEEINKNIIINYYKKTPSISLNETLKDNSLIIDGSITDSDKTFMYLKVCTSNSLIVTNSKTITIPKNQVIKIYFVYSTNNQNIEEILLCEFYQEVSQTLKISLAYDLGKLDSLRIEYEINEIKNMRVNINNMAYHDYYNKVENPNFLINIILISAGIFIFCLLVFIIYIVSKKLKKDIF